MEITMLIAGITLALFGMWAIVTTKPKNMDDYERLVKYAINAVRGVEQLISETGMGKQKKEEVIKYLQSKGLKVSLTDIELVVESIVKQMNDNKI